MNNQAQKRHVEYIHKSRSVVTNAGTRVPPRDFWKRGRKDREVMFILIWELARDTCFPPRKMEGRKLPHLFTRRRQIRGPLCSVGPPSFTCHYETVCGKLNDSCCVWRSSSVDFMWFLLALWGHRRLSTTVAELRPRLTPSDVKRRKN
jgi:hypothetical protein